jgi:two-component system, NtrC family, response regulator HydG
MSKRVLVIDDDRDHAESIVDILSMRGHTVEAAFSGEAGVKLFREQDFDIVFMDVKLPGMNGVETFFEFKKIRPNAKVMMMTGYSVEQLISQAMANGALGVLRKPFAITDLLKVLDEMKRGLVLVADDDPDFAESLKAILMQHGYRVEVASTGQEALEKAGKEGVNCLILDLAMPLLTGVEVYLKLEEAGKSIPTIFVTGFPSEKTAAMAGLRPVDQGILLKPFDPQDLIHAIAEATGAPPAAHG